MLFLIAHEITSPHEIQTDSMMYLLETWLPELLRELVLTIAGEVVMTILKHINIQSLPMEDMCFSIVHQLI